MAVGIETRPSVPAADTVDQVAPDSAAQAGPMRRVVIIVLAVLVLFGFALRVNRLGAIGFAEDEVNKVDAVHAYEQGDISANAEHPMLMKAMMYGSLKVGRWLAEQGRPVSYEALFRFPNALFGALTAIPLFLLTAAFFDRSTGLLAAGFWAAGVNAITFNRIGKEDTLLVFFMLFAFYFYLRAKQTDPRNVPFRRRNYLLSAISWGLMLASKYFPHYFGLNQLYHHNFHVRESKPGDPSGGTPRIFYLVLVLAFIIANPPVLLPQVWQYLNAYMGEKLLVHTGYLFADTLYRNNVSRSPFWGTPMYFYLVFMAVKIPIMVLVSFLLGFVVSVRRRKIPRYGFVLMMFLLWIIPYSLMGAKWLRYTLSLMPFVYMLSAIGLMELIRFIQRRFDLAGATRKVATAAIVALFLGPPAFMACTASPHFALYTNALGAGKVGYFFPHDEFYDDGLREAIKYVCDNAPAGATIAHETPAATRFYLDQFHRHDLNSKAISTPEVDVANVSAPAYFIVQRGRTYFENQEKLIFIRANYRKIYEVSVDGLTAAEVFVK